MFGIDLNRLIAIVVAVIWFAAGGIFGWAGHSAWTDFRIIPEQARICEARVRVTADAARTAEQLRQINAGRAADDAFAAAQAAAEAAAAAERENLERTIDAYRKANAGRAAACALTGGDLDFLGVHQLELQPIGR